MPPVHFTVSQIRSAAACPRILYFDARATRNRKSKPPSITRIWKTAEADERTACGSLFHAAIERFHRQAAGSATVRQAIAEALGAAEPAQELLSHVYQHHVQRASLFNKSAEQQNAFMAALRRYLGELADILSHAQALGKELPEIFEEMFGDKRRRVDVTFEVGPAGEEVHVTGILDYVFYDWRTAHNRIIDYKLTPADKPGNDLFQVCVYALMHHVQHRTEPDVGVLYLHPRRQMVEKSWGQLYAERHAIFNLLASMRAWVEYDEEKHSGLLPPGEPVYCGVCKWNARCIDRLGPKHEGTRLSHWSSAETALPAAEPATTVRKATPAAAGAKITRESTSERAAKAPRPQPAPVAAEGALLLGKTLDAERPVAMPCSVLATHVAVVGAAGSGKSWLAKVVAEESVGQKVAVLAIDPQGDLVQLVKPRESKDLSEDERLRFKAYWQALEPRIWTPGSSHGVRLCLNPVRLPALNDLTAVGDSQRRQEELEVLLTTMANNLVSLAKVTGDADCQRTFLLQVLQRLTASQDRAAVNLGDIVTTVGEPQAIGVDDPERFIKKTERERLARKLNTLIFGPAANLFHGGTPLDLQRFLTPSQAGKMPLNVVYLNALADDDQKQFFVAALAAEIYRWMLTTGSEAAAPRLLFYLDEARDYIPAGARKPPAKEPLLRLFAQGRKYGVACLLCTQSPRSVDYQIFGNCSTKLVGRLESAQDLDRVAEWFAKDGSAPRWLHDRKGAAAGTFVARWPGMPEELEGQTWKSRPLFSQHGGAWSPERVEQESRLLMND